MPPKPSKLARQQVSSAPPPAPTGPQGTSIPYSTQKGAVGGPGNAPKPQAPPHLHLIKGRLRTKKKDHRNE